MAALRYQALLIGNNFYADPALPDLKGPERDVEAMKAALTDERWGLFRDENVEAMYGRPEGAVRRGLGSFFGASTPDDVLLVYFSGHGVNDDNDLFLCTEDTRTENLLATAVGARFITQLADRAPAQRVVVLLDCCNSGLYKSDFDDSLLRGRGRFVLTSTYGPGKSPDATDGPTPFTAQLVSALTGAAANEQGYVTFRSVAAYVARTVSERTGQPVGTSGHDSGDLALAGIGQPRARQARPAPAPAAGPGAPPFTWPATPSRHDAEQALRRWAARHPLGAGRSIRRVSTVRPASTLRLTLITMEENRTERVVHRPLTDGLPAHQYVGHISDAKTPIDGNRHLWSKQTFRGWRRGSDSVRPCEQCSDGLVRCKKCGGRGKVTPANNMLDKSTTIRCAACQGSGRSNCPTCRGCGRIQTYREGTITRNRVEAPVWVTEEQPARRDGPYVDLGTLDRLAGAQLPLALQAEVDRMRKIQREASPRKRTRVDVAVLPEFAIDFLDGAATVHARLVGDDLTVHLPWTAALAVSARQSLNLATGLGRAARSHPVVAAVVAVVILAIVLWGVAR